MADGPADKIELTPQQWRDLHTNAFRDDILDRVWRRITWIFGSVSLVALIAAATAIFGPLKNQLVTEVTGQVRTDLVGRITGDTAEGLRKSAETIAREQAERQIRQGLGDPNSDLHRAVVAETRRLLGEGLVRDAMIAEAAGGFADRGGSIEKRALSFRLLHSMDDGRAREALAAAMLARLAAGAELTRDDTLPLLTEGLRALTDRPAEGAARPVLLRNVRDLAGLVVSVAETTRVPGNRVSEDYMDAAAAWFRSLGTDEDVAEWLNSRTVGTRAVQDRPPVIWDLLLREGRRPAMLRLGALLRTGPPAEVAAALRQLAESRWPALGAVEAERLLAIIEEGVPTAALAFPGLTPAMLEARWALAQAAARGTAGQRFALATWGPALRTPDPPDPRMQVWRDAGSALVRGARTEAGRAPVRAAGPESAQPVALPLADPAATAHWPALLTRLLGSVGSDDAEAFAALLLAPVPPDGGTDVTRRRDRRLAVLGLALASGSLVRDLPASGPVLRATLAALAANPGLDASPLLGAALQNVLTVAEPDACEGAVAGRQGKAPWPTAALLACAARGGNPRLDLLATWMERAEMADRPSLLRLWLIGTPRRPGFAWPQRDAADAVGTMLIEALRSEAPSPSEPLRTSPGALRLVALLRPAARDAVDAALERDGGPALFPAAEGTPAEAVPPWARRAWWDADGGPTRLPPAAGEGTGTGSVELPVPKALPWRVALACDATAMTRLVLRPPQGNRPDRLSLLVVGAGVPVQGAAGPAGEGEQRLVAAEAGCTGERFVRVLAPEGSVLVVERRVPAPVVRPARSFADRATAPPLVPGRPVRIRLAPGEEGFFAFSLAPDRLVAVRTTELAPDTDTRLAFLDGAGQVIREDDDGGGEPNASLLETEPGDAGRVAALVAGTYRDNGGEFELVVEEVASADTALGRPEALRLGRNARANRRVVLRSGRRYVATTTGLGENVDTTVEILAPDGRSLGTDDDGGGGLASRLAVTAPDDGAYRIVARNIGQPGPFTLLIQEE